MTYTLLVDNGHGRDTAGKHSPLFDDGKSRLYEWRFARDIVNRIIALAPEYGIKVVPLVTEERDIPLSVRASRANNYKKTHPAEKCVLISVHGNAAGTAKEWLSARGWEAWTTKGKTNSDLLAEKLYNAARAIFPSEFKIRTDKTDGDQDKEANFTVIYKANMPAVLTENFFYDNREDCRYMMSAKGQDEIARVHLAGVRDYFYA